MVSDDPCAPNFAAIFFHLGSRGRGWQRAEEGGQKGWWWLRGACCSLVRGHSPMPPRPRAATPLLIFGDLGDRGAPAGPGHPAAARPAGCTRAWDGSRSRGWLFVLLTSRQQFVFGEQIFTSLPEFFFFFSFPLLLGWSKLGSVANARPRTTGWLGPHHPWAQHPRFALNIRLASIFKAANNKRQGQAKLPTVLFLSLPCLLPPPREAGRFPRLQLLLWGKREQEEEEGGTTNSLLFLQLQLGSKCLIP